MNGSDCRTSVDECSLLTILGRQFLSKGHLLHPTVINDDYIAVELLHAGWIFIYLFK